MHHSSCYKPSKIGIIYIICMTLGLRKSRFNPFTTVQANTVCVALSSPRRWHYSVLRTPEFNVLLKLMYKICGRAGAVGLASARNPKAGSAGGGYLWGMKGKQGAVKRFQRRDHGGLLGQHSLGAWNFCCWCSRREKLDRDDISSFLRAGFAAWPIFSGSI